MELPRRLLRRRGARPVLLVVVVIVAWSVVNAVRGPSQPPNVKPAPLASAQADADAQDRAGEATPSGTSADRGEVVQATRVPDVPAAWRRVAEQAAAWPSPDAAPELGRPADLPTVPSSRMRDTIGLNVDLWRTEYAWADFPAVVDKVRELRLRHARVGMQAGAAYGLERMQQLGRAGVRLDVVMGDGYGRFGTAPYATLAERLRGSVLPYVDAVEGTNEADLTERADWVQVARRHQEQVSGTVEPDRGDPIGVIAPSVGRRANAEPLGDVSGLADAANAHAYASGGEPGAALRSWLAAMQPEVPGGPIVVTESGFQTDTRQRKYHTPTSPQAAAAYVPRTILEAIRRGVPQVYLYEMVDRWSDPFHVDTAAHFGLLEHDLDPKPAWSALVRLQRALLDNGRPDVAAEPVRATVEQAPADLRVLAFRKRDDTIALALWRSASVWDAERQEEIPVPAEPVRITVPADVGGALATDVVSGERRRLARGDVVSVELTGSPVVVTGLQPG
ncbi:MAG: hypothetical protein J7513_18245 [Solirubrobacteraceae bacterium]|nr:hypothetical protein [Solirubrobacteraceae bacterium]